MPAVSNTIKCLMCKVLKEKINSILTALQMIANALGPIKLDLDSILQGYVNKTTDAINADIATLEGTFNTILSTFNKTNRSGDFDSFVQGCPYIKRDPTLRKLISGFDNQGAISPDFGTFAAILTSPALVGGLLSAGGPFVDLAAILDCIDGAINIPFIKFGIRVPFLRINFGLNFNLDLAAYLADLIACLSSMCDGYDGSFVIADFDALLANLSLFQNTRNLNLADDIRADVNEFRQVIDARSRGIKDICNLYAPKTGLKLVTCPDSTSANWTSAIDPALNLPYFATKNYITNPPTDPRTNKPFVGLIEKQPIINPATSELIVNIDGSIFPNIDLRYSEINAYKELTISYNETTLFSAATPDPVDAVNKAGIMKVAKMTEELYLYIHNTIAEENGSKKMQSLMLPCVFKY